MRPSPVSAEILRISGRGNCKEAIFALGNGISRRKNQHPSPPREAILPISKSSKSVGLGRLENPLGFQPSRRERFICERAAALSRSPGDWVSGMSCGTFLRERCYPCHAAGKRFLREGFALSRSPMGFWALRNPVEISAGFLHAFVTWAYQKNAILKLLILSLCEVCPCPKRSPAEAGASIPF